MFSSLATAAALFGLAASAAPTWSSPHGNATGYRGTLSTTSSYAGAPSPGGYGGSPTPSSSYGGSPASSSGPQVPFKFPLANGFPNITNGSAALTAIEQQAHGTLPNTPLPSSIADASATTWQLISFNEAFEVAFFSSLLNNITTGGWQIGGSAAARQIAINALTAVRAQEELHYLGATGVLAAAGRTTIQPCEYVFPSDSFDSAIALAATFTDVVLGTLQDALNNFGTDGDTEFLALIGSIVGQEGEQNGFYRTEGGRIPSQLPFLTRSAGPFAFSALNQMFVVAGSCPNLDAIDLPLFGALNVLTPTIAPADQDLRFSFTTNGTSLDPTTLRLVYINQQNAPVVEPLTDVQTSGNTVSFSAAFPYQQYLMNGLTIAAVTNSAGPFAGADDVANAALYGPGLIEIN